MQARLNSNRSFRFSVTNQRNMHPEYLHWSDYVQGFHIWRQWAGAFAMVVAMSRRCGGAFTARAPASRAGSHGGNLDPPDRATGTSTRLAATRPPKHTGQKPSPRTPKPPSSPATMRAKISLPPNSNSIAPCNEGEITPRGSTKLDVCVG